MFLLSLLLAAEPLPDIQFMDLEGLSPQQIGERVLANEEHRVIEKVERERGVHLMPPGFVYLQLFERPERSGDECRGTYWSASFHLGLEGMQGEPGLHDLYKTEQIALSPDAPCSFAKYASLGRGTDADYAFDRLRELNAIIDGRQEVDFECTDSTNSGLCRSSKDIPSALRYLDVWHVKQEDAQAIFWLRHCSDNISTEVRLPNEDGALVRVDRRIPPPA